MIDNDRYAEKSRYGQELDNGRIRSVHMDDFFCIQRWMKQLEEAKNSDPAKIYSKIDQIMREMKTKTDEYSALSSKEREELKTLAQFPEPILSKYYNK